MLKPPLAKLIQLLMLFVSWSTISLEHPSLIAVGILGSTTCKTAPKTSASRYLHPWAEPHD